LVQRRTVSKIFHSLFDNYHNDKNHFELEKKMSPSPSVVNIYAIFCWNIFWIPAIYCLSIVQSNYPLRHRGKCLISQSTKRFPFLNSWSSFNCLDASIHTRQLQSTMLYENIHEGGNYDDDYEEEDDDEPPEVDIRNFRYPSSFNATENKNDKRDNGTLSGKNSSFSSFGLGRGRSSPSQRKAMGTSSKTSTTVYVCSNCGGESVQWRGRCPTCKEWNTFQEVKVQRSSTTPSSHGPAGGTAHNLLAGRNRNEHFGREHTNPDIKHKLDGQSWLDGISVDGSDIHNHNGLQNRPISISDIDLEVLESRRLKVPNDDEMNEVLGGGLMKGSLILLGGDPGVGKSTLALQLAAQVATLSVAPVGIGMGPSPVGPETIGPVWYVSGEETLEQIATRAQRLVASNEEVESTIQSSTGNRLDSLPKQLLLLSETNLNILADEVVRIWVDEKSRLEDINFGTSDSSCSKPQSPNTLPSLIVIDSIQTMVCEAGGASSAGGITQVRESMALLLRLAKMTQIPILTIGHVTKAGDVAGPRMVEHMVDAVLYFEHSQSSGISSLCNGKFRWLRAQKNRFGSCQFVGLYDFQGGVLVPLPEGTESTLAPPAEDLEGCAMGICVEGPHRAMAVEVQALVTVTSGSFGRKTVEGGLSSARLNLLLGILQKHCQLPIAGGGRTSRDVYVNVVGCDGTVSKSRLSLATMALDLAVTVALTSSYLSISARGDTACLAQVGLLGELRPLSSLESRLLQAQRMGFSRVIVASAHSTSSHRKPKKSKKSQPLSSSQNRVHKSNCTQKFGLDIYECSTLKEALNIALISPLPTQLKKSARRQVVINNSKEPDEKISPPGSLRDLNLDNEIILDDEDDEDDYDF
jgi:DNA repair protein RadA/Sms